MGDGAMSQRVGVIPLRIDGRGHTQDLTASRLSTAWLMHDCHSTPTGTDALAREAQTLVQVNPNEPTLVVLADEVPAVEASAAAVVEAGGTIYALGPAGWAGGTAPDWLAMASSTKVLIRRVRDAPMAAVLNGSQGWLWLGHNGSGPWRLTLDAGQVAAARAAFLNLFWMEADDEAWPANGGLQWHACGEAPFDLPKTPVSAAVRLNEATRAQPPIPGPEGAVYCPDGALPAGSAARVWLPPSGTNHAQLAQTASAGTDIGWTDLGLPPCATGLQPVMNAATARWSLRVDLSPSQADALTQLLTREPGATFRTDVSLAEAREWAGPGGRVWLADRPAPEALIEEQQLDGGVVAAESLRDMFITEPPSWAPMPSPLALSARWSWQIRAPQSPAGATDDPLMKTWDEIDRRYRGELDSAKKVLTGLAGTPLVGITTAREELRTRLGACEATPPSAAGPEGARALLALMATLTAKATELADRLAAVEREQTEKVERRHQKDNHTHSQAAARKALAKHTKELAGKKQRRAEIDTELNELDARRGEAGAHDPKVARRDLSDESARLKKSIEQLEGNVERDRATIERDFEYRPPPVKAGTTPKKTHIPPPPSLTKITVPDQAPPTVGRLRRAGNDRVLAIRTWDDLTEGEAEAARLGARLVADGEEH
jgi:hypothetical protein